MNVCSSSGIHSGGVGPPDQATHAGSGGHIDRDPVLLQPADDTDVRDAARAAAAECDTHRRSLRFSHDSRRALRPPARPRGASRRVGMARRIPCTPGPGILPSAPQSIGVRHAIASLLHLTPPFRRHRSLLILRLALERLSGRLRHRSAWLSRLAVLKPAHAAHRASSPTVCLARLNERHGVRSWRRRRPTGSTRPGPRPSLSPARSCRRTRAWPRTGTS